jgi:methanogenic corrinoid protein MtbC1
MEYPYGLIDRLALQVMNEHKKAQPELLAMYTGEPNDPWLEETRKQLIFLFDAAIIDSPQLFSTYVAWSKVVLKHTGAPTSLLQEKLQHMREECSKLLEGPIAARVDRILEETLREFPQMPETIPPYIGAEQELGKIAATYLEQVLSGEKRQAQETVTNAMEQGVSLREIYLSILQRTQYEMGRRWQHGAVSVAQEHYVTEVTQQIMARLIQNVPSRPDQKGTVVVTCVGNELHEMGARMVADFLELDGWGVIFLGANTPHPDVLSMLREKEAGILLVSATMGYNVTRVRGLIRHVHGDPKLRGVRVVVGGYPFNHAEDLWRKIGADAFAKNAEDAVRVVNSLS